MSLIQAQKITERVFGPRAFYTAIAKLWTFHGHQKTHLTWDDWDEFFRLAEEYDMNTGDQGPKGEFLENYPVMLRNIVLQRRRVMAARERGESAWQFHQSEKHRVLREEHAFREQQKHIEVQRAQLIAQSRQKHSSRNAPVEEL